MIMILFKWVQKMNQQTMIQEVLFKVLGTVRAKILDNLYLNPNETFKRIL